MASRIDFCGQRDVYSDSTHAYYATAIFDFDEIRTPTTVAVDKIIELCTRTSERSAASTYFCLDNGNRGILSTHAAED